jgi:hypothetical protein
MPASYPEIRKFSGLFLQQNSFDVPDGAMETCRNVEIQSDAVLTKTRGWYRYWTPGLGQELRGLVEYGGFLHAFGNGFGAMYFTNDTSVDPNSPLGVPHFLIGDTPTFDYTTRTEEQNQNLYFTTAAEVSKLESVGSKIRKAGVPPGLDLLATAITGSSGPLPPDSQTAYRILFGRRDTNNNLLLGAPSDISTVGLSPDGTGFTYTSSGAGPYTVTVTTIEPHGLTVGDSIIITGATNVNANGTHIVTATPTPFTYQYSTTLNPASGTLDYSYSKSALLEFSIPIEIEDVGNDEWFYQVYRTTSSAGVTVSPTPDFALIAEVMLTTADLAARVIFFTDDVDPILQGAELYTNPNSREGELQANARPPHAQDIQNYKNYMLYSNTFSKQRLFVSLVDPSGLTSATVSFDLGATHEEYAGGSVGVRNQTKRATASGVGIITITFANHGAVTGWTVDIGNVTGNLPPGVYTVGNTTVNTFEITAVGLTASALNFSFVTNTLGVPVFYVDNVSSSLAVQIANTAYNLVKAVNRSSDILYANYTSGFDDAPGKMRFETQHFDQVNTLRMSTTATPEPFIPPSPIYATSDNFINGIYVSKIGEPEAVPIINFFRVGAKQKAIKRIFALRDSVIVLKEDGIFRLTGDTVDQFQITILDGTVLAISEMGVDNINNTVVGITNQGVVSISESSVQIISRRIDDVIQPALIDVNLAAAFGYETGRTWFISINQTILGRPPQTYLYNVLNQSWTSTDVIFRNLALGPGGEIFSIIGQEGNYILRQRRAQNFTDFSGEFAEVDAQANPGGASAVIEFTGAGNPFVPAAGDVLLYQDIFSRIQSVEQVGATYTVTFNTPTNIPETGPPVEVIIYQAFESAILFSPFHAGQVGREKQFTEFQLHLRQNTITNLNISFTTESFGSSGQVDWAVTNVTQTFGGWGSSPWGIFPWGLEQSINILPGTLPAVMIRTYIPLFAARCTWIAPVLNHRQAAEPLLIQSLSYTVRGYGERVTR